MAKIVITIIIILFLVGFFIARANDLDLRKGGDQIEFVKANFKWLYKSVLNTKKIVGFVISQDWSIADKTNESVSE